MTDVSLTQPNPVVAEEHELHRSLGPVHLTMIGIGAIIGAGIFVITGQVAADYAGPAVLLSFIVAGTGCLFAGLCYAEFASMIPVSGSAYTYAYATMGRFMAWFIGWNLVLEYLFSSSTVAVGWSGYFTELMQFLHFNFPASLANAPLCVIGDPPPCPHPGVIAGHGLSAFIHQFGFTGAIVNLPAVLLTLILTSILVVGVRESANTNAIMVAIKVVVVLLVIAFGFGHINWGNFTPFIPTATGRPGQFGWAGVMTGSAIIFFAYIGFDSVSVAAQEKNPQRDLPIGILASLFICTVLYMLMSIVLLGMAYYTTMSNIPNPVSFAVGKIASLHWLVPIIDVGASVGLASTIFVGLYGQSRIFYAMSRDGFLPKMFAAVHPRFHTPHRGTIITGVAAAAIAAVFPINLLGQLVSIGTLLAFVVVCGGIMILRIQAPNARRPFRTPFVWFVAPAGIAVCGYMMVSLPGDTWWRLAIWTAIGLVIYFVYGIHHALPSKWKVAKEG